MAANREPPDSRPGRRWAPDLGGLLEGIRRTQRQWQLVLGLSAALGLVSGLVLVGVETLITNGLLDPLLRAPPAVQMVVPTIGLAAVWAVLRFTARSASPFISDEYIKAYHDPAHPIDLSLVPQRVVTGIITLGSGAAMGLEALGIYVGAAASTVFNRRFTKLLAGENARIFLVAGAAAGVSAVFKAPATGAVFALEVPYQQDTAAGAVLPAMVGAAVAYLVVALTKGTEPIISVAGNPSFSAVDLLGALIVGVSCGVGGRVFAVALNAGKGFVGRSNPAVRIAATGVVLGALVAVTRSVYGHPFSLGPGYDVITWATDPRQGLWLVAALFVLRLLATAATQWGGGTGGAFVPLVVQGALLGRLVQGLLEAVGIGSAARAGNLFVLVGMAAFLGAGYRVPLAAVVFVAESTGKPGFIVPGLLACAAAQLVMGRQSVSTSQRQLRTGHVEGRLELAVEGAMRTGVHTVSPMTTIEDLLHDHLPVAQARSVPVVDDDGLYRGIVSLSDIDAVPRDRRATTVVGDVLGAPPTAEGTWPLRTALETMRRAGLQRLAVVAGDGRFLGMLTLSDIVGLDELAGPPDGDRPAPGS